MRNPENKSSSRMKPTPDAETAALHKEWDDARCPICMDHPHNAVLLLCSSHDKGCRSYVCDTSYRHSNCLDRFRKMHVSQTMDSTSSAAQPLESSSSLPGGGTTSNQAPLALQRRSRGRGGRSHRLAFSEDLGHHQHATRNRSAAAIAAGQEEGTSSYNQDDADLTLEALEAEGTSGPAEAPNNSSNQLLCPLCRGAVKGWEIIRDARQYWDGKPRACSRETCSFSGTYGALRKHARRVHPATRPADVDPSRRRAWHRLEHQREYGDIVSAIRSAMPGAVVFGDYAIEEGGGEHDEDSSVPSNSLLRTFFLFHMMNTSPARSGDEHRVSSSRGMRRRRYLWGENLLGLQYDEEEEDEEVQRPRSRRRLVRSRSEERRR